MSRNASRETVFRFKKFSVANSESAMKVGTDGVLAGAWADAIEPKRILDIGTGTGLIALMMAQRFPEASVTAVEIDPVAAHEAKNNFCQSIWADSITVINEDFISWSGKTTDRFDLIVSNPPFFTTGERSADKQRAMARHCDTLGPIQIIDSVSRILTEKGRIAMIIPSLMTEELIYHGTIARLYPLRICDVISTEGKKPTRTLIEFTTVDSMASRSILIIKNRDGYTESYRKLTSDFYLQF